MSVLLFDRKLRRVGLVRRNSKGKAYFVGIWDAHNDVQKDKKPWPKGGYRWSHYNEHKEEGLAPGCFPQTYGCFGIHVFSVDGRSGMGVHAGRTFGEADRLGRVTYGCIRVPSNAMTTINETHETDPLTWIYVEDDLVTRMAERDKAKSAI